MTIICRRKGKFLETLTILFLDWDSFLIFLFAKKNNNMKETNFKYYPLRLLSIFGG